MCIASNGAFNFQSSTQNPISCDTTSKGCSGGTLSASWRFFASAGQVKESDYPYTSGTNGVTGTCLAKPNATRYYSKSFRTLSTVQDMQYEVRSNYNF